MPSNGPPSALPPYLAVPGQQTPTSPHKIAREENGYVSIAFVGKKAQAARVRARVGGPLTGQVEQLVTENGFVPANLVHGEVTWFYDVRKPGLDVADRAEPGHRRQLLQARVRRPGRGARRGKLGAQPQRHAVTC